MSYSLSHYAGYTEITYALKNSKVDQSTLNKNRTIKLKLRYKYSKHQKLFLLVNNCNFILRYSR